MTPRRVLAVLIGIGALFTLYTDRKLLTGLSSDRFLVEDEGVTPAPLQSLPLPPLCSREQLKEGKWVPATWHRPPYKPKAAKCNYDDDFLQKPWETYEWEPTDMAAVDAKSSGDNDNNNNACTFEMFDPHEFCKLAANKTISIVGDSLSYEHLASLVHWLGGFVKTFKIWPPKKRNNKIWFHEKVCNGTVQLHFKSTRYLESLTDVTSMGNITNDGQVYPPTDVLVINRGAYFKPDEEVMEGIEQNLKELQVWQDTCRDAGRDCHLLYRTSVPGVTKCWEFDKPSTNLTEMEDRIGMYGNNSLWSHAMKTFHWGDFKRQNHLVLDAFRKTNLTYDVIDGYEILMLRPDAHVGLNADCMHNCEPGKLIVYNQLLMHFMMIRRDKLVAENKEEEEEESKVARRRQWL